MSEQKLVIVGAGHAAGQLVATDGTVLGQHPGIEGFTVGQRKGLGVALGERKFVVRIEPDSKRVVIGDREELYLRELSARDTNWLVESFARAIGKTTRCFAQIRYNAAAQPAQLTVLPDGRMRVVFDEPQFAITPGQAAVFYQDDLVVGGGWIAR